MNLIYLALGWELNQGIRSIWAGFMHVNFVISSHIFMKTHGQSTWQGRGVLVIHSFAKLIKRQYYQNRLHIFPGRDVLPRFWLNVIEAVQTLAGERDKRFESWFDALGWMEGEALAVDFDVAIIGCGAYGFPLPARLKKYGKKVFTWVVQLKYYSESRAVDGMKNLSFL